MSRGNSIPHLWMVESVSRLLRIAHGVQDPTAEHIIASEKVDGVNAVFGIEPDTNRIYVSREKKCGDRFYCLSQIRESTTGAKRLLEILFQHVYVVLDEIIKTHPDISKKGMSFECEMMYFGNTNVVRYSTSPNYVVILNHDVDKADKMAIGPILTRVVNVVAESKRWTNEVSYVATQNLECKCNFLFSQELRTLLSPIEPVGFDTMLNSFVDTTTRAQEDFLANYGMDIDTAARIKLNVGPRSDIETRRAARDSAKETIRILGMELFFLLYHRSGLSMCPSAYAPHPKYRTGSYCIPEGVVCVMEDGFRFKLVDPTTFSSLNQYYHSIENQLINKMVPKQPHELVTVRSLKDHALNENGNMSAYMMCIKLITRGNVTTHSVVRKEQQKEKLTQFPIDADLVSELEQFYNHLNTTVREEIYQIQQMSKARALKLSSSGFTGEVEMDDEQWSRNWSTYHQLLKFVDSWKVQIKFAHECGHTCFSLISSLSI